MARAKAIQKPKGWRVETAIFYANSSAASCILPGGCGAAILTRNAAADVRGPLPKGEMCVVRPDNPSGQWPVIVAFFDWDDADKWRNLSTDQINLMVDRCHRGAMRYINGVPVRNGDISPTSPPPQQEVSDDRTQQTHTND